MPEVNISTDEDLLNARNILLIKSSANANQSDLINQMMISYEKLNSKYEQLDGREKLGCGSGTM